MLDFSQFHENERMTTNDDDAFRNELMKQCIYQEHPNYGKRDEFVVPTSYGVEEITTGKCGFQPMARIYT